VTALGWGAGVAAAGAIGIQYIDTRFDPRTAIIGGNTLELGYAHGLRDGEAVVYDTGGGQPIAGLVSGGTYYAIVDASTPTRVRLALTPGEPPSLSSRPHDRASRSASSRPTRRRRPRPSPRAPPICPTSRRATSTARRTSSICPTTSTVRRS
jgi:hypothetical protein